MMNQSAIEIQVKDLPDRLAVAAVLLKNGYTVSFIRRKDGKTYQYFVIAICNAKDAKEETA